MPDFNITQHAKAIANSQPRNMNNDVKQNDTVSAQSEEMQI